MKKKKKTLSRNSILVSLDNPQKTMLPKKEKENTTSENSNSYETVSQFWNLYLPFLAEKNNLKS